MKEILVGSDFSGIGAFDQALNFLNINYKKSFACDYDQFARKSFIENYGNEIDKKLLENQEYLQLCKIVKNIIEGKRKASNNDSFLKQANDFSKRFSFYYPFNVYDREIPETPLDIFMTSPPCQAFSLAGKRKGENDKRGVLFYNSLEFISKNKPRYFIFENVKGLLSDDNGKTFARWVDLLGGKSVNGNPVIFPNEESVPYHIYYKVINSKDFGVPQNRERIFIIGIRDDADNNFTFPKEQPLTKRLKDVLEENVDEKYYLSDVKDKRLNEFLTVNNPKDLELIDTYNQVSNTEIAHTITTRINASNNSFLRIKSATSKGYELAEIGEDSINLEHPNLETRRGRVGVGVAQTLTTSCNQGVAIGALRGRNPDNPKSRKSGENTEQMLEINQNGVSNCLTTVQKDNLVVNYNYPKVKTELNSDKWLKTHEQSRRVYDDNGISPTIHTMSGGGQEIKIENNYSIRKLTPRECLRLMGFPDSFKIKVSDSQAYKQAGNSIVVNVLVELIKKLKLD